jgi:N-acetylglucosaminyldiphosphoundecaprenol N-acetyl-beta-D-mannosaminyltransferase
MAEASVPGPAPLPRTVPVVGLELSPLSLGQTAEQVLAWAQAGESRTLCAANVHMVMEAHDDSAFQAVVNGSDLVVPDGVPLAWALRLLTRSGQERVYGPGLMLETCRLASLRGVPVGLYGSTPAVLDLLRERLGAQFPALAIPFVCSPPFRPLTPGEEEALLEDFRASGAAILFVGLGCPKQERWMAAQRPRLPAVMLGVGAAFDFHAGTLPQAPAWMQRAGLEWLFRLAQEPRRLWKRYLKHNPRFVALLLLQLVRR